MTQVDSVLLQQLVQMGFDQSRAEEALLATGNKSIDQAIEHIYANQQPLIQQQQQSTPSTTTSTPPSSYTPQTPYDVKRNAAMLHERREGRLKGDSYETKLEFEAKKRQADADKLKQQKLDEKKRLQELRRKMKAEKEERLRQQEERLARLVNNMAEHTPIVTRTYDLKPVEKPKVEVPVEVQQPPVTTTTGSAVRNSTIQIRLPSGQAIMQTTTSDKTLQDVYEYIVSSVEEFSDRNERFSLVSPVPPRTEYNPEELDLSTVSLQQAGLVPRGSLIVQKLKSKGKLIRGGADPMTDEDPVTDNTTDEVSDEDIYIENSDIVTSSLYILTMKGPWVNVPEEEKEYETIHGKGRAALIFRPKLWVEQNCDNKKRTAINFIGHNILSESRVDYGNGSVSSHSGGYKLRYNATKRRTELTVAMNNEPERAFDVVSLTDECLILSN